MLIFGLLTLISTVGGISAAVSKTAAAPIERIKLLIQNQVCFYTYLSHSHSRKPEVIEMPEVVRVRNDDISGFASLASDWSDLLT